MCLPIPEGEAPEVDLFYNGYHSLKTTGEPRECWIPSEARLERLLRQAGFSDLKANFSYRSNVVTAQWLIEGQVSRDRYDFLNGYILDHTERFPRIRDVFKIDETGVELGGKREKSVKISFPVIVFTGTKEK